MLTKGEAEAKALAMRADAYKQFNEAAIIQTVLAALPDIVRAAAEPMSHIDSLTVMSADGASDIVRNATRAMIESTTAIKGLTGLDVPNLVGGALGRGFGERLRTGEGNGDATGASATDRISEIAGQGLTALKAQTAHDAVAAKSAAEEVSAKAADEVEKAKQAAEKVMAATESKVAATEAKVAPGDGNVKQWAKWMADQLRQLPDIGVYGRLRLRDLAQRGPASARGIWATAKDALSQDYGNVTIDDLLGEFQALQK